MVGIADQLSWYFVSLPRCYFSCGSRTAGEVLSCRDKKVPKEALPSGATAPALLGRDGGFSTAPPCPAKNARLPGAPLAGLIRLDLRCSARRKGGNVNTKSQNQRHNLKAFGWDWFFRFGCRPLSRTEHRRAARTRPARGAHGMSALAAGQDVLSANPLADRGAQGTPHQSAWRFGVGCDDGAKWLWLLSPKGK